jgi:hypothetical protein
MSSSKNPSRRTRFMPLKKTMLPTHMQTFRFEKSKNHQKIFFCRLIEQRSSKYLEGGEGLPLLLVSHMIGGPSALSLYPAFVVLRVLDLPVLEYLEGGEGLPLFASAQVCGPSALSLYPTRCTSDRTSCIVIVCYLNVLCLRI